MISLVKSIRDWWYIHIVLWSICPLIEHLHHRRWWETVRKHPIHIWKILMMRIYELIVDVVHLIKKVCLRSFLKRRQEGRLFYALVKWRRFIEFFRVLYFYGHKTLSVRKSGNSYDRLPVLFIYLFLSYTFFCETRSALFNFTFLTPFEPLPTLFFIVNFPLKITYFFLGAWRIFLDMLLNGQTSWKLRFYISWLVIFSIYFFFWLLLAALLVKPSYIID